MKAQDCQLGARRSGAGRGGCNCGARPGLPLLGGGEYQYPAGPRFRQRVQAIVEKFTDTRRTLRRSAKR